MLQKPRVVLFYSLADKNPYTLMGKCLLTTSTVQENSVIRVRELLIPSKGDVSDSASSFSSSGDEHILNHTDALYPGCLAGCPGRQPVRGRVQSLLQEGSFCL